MSRIPVIAALICFCFTLSHAQDSVKKKLNPSKLHPTYKNPTYPAYKPHVAAKPDSAKIKQIQPVKPDTAAPPIVLDKSLNGQYQYLLTKVYHYQQPFIAALWKTASDTLAATRGKLKAAQSKIAVQTKAIDSLNTALASEDQNVSTTNARVNEIDVFGMYVSKTVYNLVVWGLVIVFGITAMVVIMQSGKYRHDARYRTRLYSELEEEFKAYKAKANDKEKKLARELQTERNKLDELLGRG